jgi:hypothetical protein
MGFWHWVGARFVTIDAIYGLILYAALIAATSDTDSHSDSVLFFSIFSLLIFWGAHIYAGTIVNHAANTPLGTAIWTAMKHSSGMLWASIPPSIPLLVGISHAIPDDVAVDCALLVATIMLGALGFVAFSRRKAPMVTRIFGSIGAALFGVLVIALNAAVH